MFLNGIIVGVKLWLIILVTQKNGVELGPKDFITTEKNMVFFMKEFGMVEAQGEVTE